jgi:hypothetical protein
MHIGTKEGKNHDLKYGFPVDHVVIFIKKTGDKL